MFIPGQHQSLAFYSTHQLGSRNKSRNLLDVAAEYSSHRARVYSRYLQYIVPSLAPSRCVTPPTSALDRSEKRQSSTEGGGKLRNNASNRQAQALVQDVGIGEKRRAISGE